MPPRFGNVKTWQIFGVGVLVAIALCGIVAVGFYLCPRKDVFYVRTTAWRMHLDRNLSCEHKQLAIKVELARLWLLFVPPSLAVSFLIVTPWLIASRKAL